MIFDIQVRDEVKHGNGPHTWTVGEIVERPKLVANLHRTDPVTTRVWVPLSELLLVNRPVLA